MNIETSPSFSVQIYIAGNRTDAAKICREFCFNVGYCVTVSDTEYVYTGGMESGVVIGLINYPRFPREPGEILKVAEQLGMALMTGLCQHSFSIVTPQDTYWHSRRPE